jgi:hypothetical protein
MPADHLLIYRSFSVEELETEIHLLKQKYKSEFTSNSGGGISASRDIQFVAEKLEAATKALNEKRRKKISKTLATFGV